MGIGSQEVHFPAMIPREIFEESGRWSDYGDTLFRLSDRKDVDYLLAPTHEELFTLLVKGEYSSYKDYPLALFQIQTKYRDEARPRAGHPARARVHHEGLVLLRPVRRGTGARPITRTATPTSGSSPASASSTRSSSRCPARWAARRRRSSWRRRRRVRTRFVQCTNCDYAANTEAVEIAAPEPSDPADHPPPQVLDTPDTPTIETLVARMRELGHDTTAADTLKNVVLRTHTPGADGWELLVVGVPGDREVDLKRIGGQFEPVARRAGRPGRPRHRSRGWSRATSGRRCSPT